MRGKEEGCPHIDWLGGGGLGALGGGYEPHNKSELPSWLAECAVDTDWRLVQLIRCNIWCTQN